MIGTETLDRVIGKDVYDEAGQKIGSAGEVYLDDETGQPEWVTVRTGMFGTKESFVPIRDADLTDDGLRVPVSKDRVKDAPKIDTDGHLSPQEEQELYRYYGMGAGTTGQTQTNQTSGMDLEDTSGRHMAGTGTVGTGTAGMTDAGMTDTDTNRHGTVGHDTSGPTTDDAMTRSEERMQVGTTTEEAGRARLRKYVVSENVTQTVPVTREEVRVEREPITDANLDAATSGPDLSEEEHEVTLRAEEPVVEKTVVPKERVRLDKDTIAEERTVSDEVRREEIEVEGGERTITDADRDNR